MKGLASIPGTATLMKMYGRFYKGSVTYADIALSSQWTRFDPRLGEILLVYLEKNWRNISPFLLRNELLKLPWPAAMGVVLEFLKPRVSHRRSFDSWRSCVLHDIAPAASEQFFIGVHAFAGKAARKNAIQPLKPYVTWGYLASDPIIAPLKSVTSLNSAIRQKILKDYLRDHATITVKEFVSLCDGNIHVKQAQRDLQNSPILRSKGYTRNKIYIRKR